MPEELNIGTNHEEEVKYTSECIINNEIELSKAKEDKYYGEILESECYQNIKIKKIEKLSEVVLESNAKLVKIKSIESEEKNISLKITSEGKVIFKNGKIVNVNNIELKVKEEVGLEDIVSEARFLISSKWLELSGKLDFRKGDIEIQYKEEGVNLERLGTGGLKVLYVNEININGDRYHKVDISIKGKIYANKLYIKGINNLKIDEGSYYLGKSEIEVEGGIDIFGKISGMGASVKGGIINFREGGSLETENILDKKSNNVVEGEGIKIESEEFYCSQNSEINSVSFIDIRSKDNIDHNCIIKGGKSTKITGDNINLRGQISVDNGLILINGDNLVNIEGIILSKRGDIILKGSNKEEGVVNIEGVVGAGQDIEITGFNTIKIKEESENIKEVWKEVSDKWLIYESGELENANIISKEGKINIECKSYKGEGETIINYRKGKIEWEYGIKVKIKENFKQTRSNIKSGTGIKYSSTEEQSIISVDGTIGKGSIAIETYGNVAIGKAEIFSDKEIRIKSKCLEVSEEGVILGLVEKVLIHVTNNGKEQCDFVNYGSIGSNGLLYILVSSGHFENRGMIVSDYLILEVNRYNLVNTAYIAANNHAKFGVWSEATIKFKEGSETIVGNYEIAHSNKETLRIGKLLCEGCHFIKTKQGTSILRAEDGLIKVAHYEKSQPILVGEKALVYHRYIDEGFWFWEDDDLVEYKANIRAYKEYHDYRGVPQVLDSGNVVFDVKRLVVDVGNVNIAGTAKFENKPMIEVKSRATKKFLDISSNYITWINTLDNVQNEFGIQDASLVVSEGRGVPVERLFTGLVQTDNYHIYQKYDVLNSVFYANKVEGEIYNIEVGVSTGNDIPAPISERASNVKQIEGSSKRDEKALSGKTNMLAGYIPEVSYYQEKIEITKENLRSEGADIASIFDERGLTAQMWNKEGIDIVYKGKNGCEIIYIISLKKVEKFKQLIKDPLDICNFLNNLGYTWEDKVHIKGDSHYYERAIRDVVFKIIGVIKGQDYTKLLQDFARNAKEEQERLKEEGINLIAGEKIKNKEILSKNIVWPVMVNNGCRGISKCMTLEIYYDENTIENIVEGAALIGGEKIDLRIDGRMFIDVHGRVEGGKLLMLQGGRIYNAGKLISDKEIKLDNRAIENVGIVYVKEGTIDLVASQDIINVGLIQIESGDCNGYARIKAGNDIKELFIVDESNPLPEYASQSAVYVINGNLYYEAGRDIIQQASQKLVNCDIIGKAGRDIIQESKHRERVIREERYISDSETYWLIERAVDEYRNIDMARGNIIYSAKGEYKGHGQLLHSKDGDIIIDGKKGIKAKTITGYSKNQYYWEKERLLSSSQTYAENSVSDTSYAEMTAEKGKVHYISGGKCIFEGIQIYGQKPIVICEEGIEINAHKVTAYMKVESYKKGIMPAKLPIYELIKSDKPEQHLRSNIGLVSSLHQVINMKSATDLMGVTSLAMEIVSFKRSMGMFKEMGMNIPGAVISTLLSNYASIKLTIGYTEVKTEHKKTFVLENNIKGVEVYVESNGDIIMEAVKLYGEKKSDIMVGGKLTLRSGEEIFIEESHAESFGVDLEINTAGGKIGVSGSDQDSYYKKNQYKKTEIRSEEVNINVNKELNIEGATIDGKKVGVDALEVYIKDVMDKEDKKIEGSSFGMGINIGWDGSITPYGAISDSEIVEKSGVTKFISGITGEDIKITAKKLRYQLGQIAGEHSEEINVEKIELEEKEKDYHYEKEKMISMSVESIKDSKGNRSPNVKVCVRNGDYSACMSSELIKELISVKDKIKSIDSKEEQKKMILNTINKDKSKKTTKEQEAANSNAQNQPTDNEAKNNGGTGGDTGENVGNNNPQEPSDTCSANANQESDAELSKKINTELDILEQSKEISPEEKDKVKNVLQEILNTKNKQYDPNRLKEDPIIRMIKKGNIEQVDETADKGSKAASSIKNGGLEDIKGKIINIVGNKIAGRLLDRIIPFLNLYNFFSEQEKVRKERVEEQKAREFIKSLEADTNIGDNTETFPIPKKTPDLPGYPINDNDEQTIGTYPEAEKQEKLPGFTPAEPLEGLKGSIITDQNLEDYILLKDIPDTVDKVGPNYPRNSEYAGKKYPLDKLSEDLKLKYPNSIDFNEKGFPDFKPYTVKEVEIEFSKNRGTDELRANKAAGIKKTPGQYTWHHDAITEKMQLVPRDIHDAVKHTGYFAIKTHQQRKTK